MSVQDRQQTKLPIKGGRLQPVLYSQLSGWVHDDHIKALEVFRLSAQRMLEKPYRNPNSLFETADLLDIAKIAIALDGVSQEEARRFFEGHFEPQRVFPNDGSAGFITGYFEPVVKASRVQTEEFYVPLYKRPDDLVEISDTDLSSNLDPSFRFGRRSGTAIVEYFDRQQIRSGALQNRGLELVWLADKTDAFFIHVQGSARLELPDQTTMRVTYSAKSGHPYSSIGKLLAQRLNLAPAQMTADRLASWMRSNPDKIDELTDRNRSHIFFKEISDLRENDGPIAAAKVPLTPHRSIAVDRDLYSFGLPVWLETLDPLPNQDRPLSRLMIAQDTGSAIVGPARADYFVGTGDDAGIAAGRIRHAANMTILMPKS